jgi:hypothetical protein
VDDEATERVDFGGLAGEQQGGGVELGGDRRAVDVVASAQPGAIVDRRVDPALGERYRLAADARGAGIAALRQLRQLRQRKDACPSTLRVTSSTGVSSWAKV